MTELQRIQQAKAAIQQAPGGEIWLEEMLIRGEPSGAIKGAHVIYSWRAADAFGGKTAPQQMAPFPVTIAAEEPAFALVVSEINAAALATVQQQAAEITSLQRTVTDLEATRDSLQSQLQAATAERDGWKQQRDLIMADRNALLAQRDAIQLQLDAMQQAVSSGD